MALIFVQPPLPSAPAGADFAWAGWSNDGKRLRKQGIAPPALLPGQDDVTVVLPAAALSWQQVTLPQGSTASAARLRSVLGGMLEDRLLDEPEQLHFALEPGAKTGVPVWVAICHKGWLRGVVQSLEGAGRRIARLVPEFTPRPASTPPLLVATGDPDAAQLTLCDQRGVLSLPLTAAGLSLAGPLPETAVATTEPAVAEIAEGLLGRSLAIVPAPARWLEASQLPWDLAQFDFATSGRARAGKQLAAFGQALWRAPRWRAARWGAGVLVAAQLIGVNAWAWKERQALDTKRAAIGQTLTQTFPSVTYVSDQPALQMSREVALLQQATGGVTPADLEPMLGALAASLPPGRVPTAIDYSAGQLRLRGLGLSLTELGSLGTQMAARGYNARGEGDLLLVQAEAAR